MHFSACWWKQLWREWDTLTEQNYQGGVEVVTDGKDSGQRHEWDYWGRQNEERLKDKEKADELDQGFKANGILQMTRQERQFQKQDKMKAGQ